MNRTCATRSGRTQCAGSLVFMPRRERRLRDLARPSAASTRASSSRLIEARSRVADVRERVAVVLVVHAEQQRAEVLARLSRFGPAADDELLFVQELQLPPGRAAPSGLVRRRAPPLTISPSQPSRVRPRLQRAAVAADLLADAERVRRSRVPMTLLRGARGVRVSGSPRRSSSPSRSRSKAMSATGCALSISRDVARCRQVDASLQPLEPGGASLLVERDDLAVERAAGPSQAARAAVSSARTIDGNCAVFSLPRRDQMRTPSRPPARAARATSARMPSYLGS